MSQAQARTRTCHLCRDGISPSSRALVVTLKDPATDQPVQIGGVLVICEGCVRHAATRPGWINRGLSVLLAGAHLPRVVAEWDGRIEQHSERGFTAETQSAQRKDESIPPAQIAVHADTHPARAAIARLSRKLFIRRPSLFCSLPEGRSLCSPCPLW